MKFKTFELLIIYNASINLFDAKSLKQTDGFWNFTKPKILKSLSFEAFKSF